jgi:hypothetical protein
MIFRIYKLVIVLDKLVLILAIVLLPRPDALNIPQLLHQGKFVPVIQ